MKAILYFAAPLLLLTASCVTTAGLARQRASHEFHCEEDRVVLKQRPELSDGTYDADACGHHARYTCWASRGEQMCTREPL